MAWCRGQAEKEFKVEVEAIGRVRHKNLVRLLGYCAEGAHRYFVLQFRYVASLLIFVSSSWNSLDGFLIHSPWTNMLENLYRMLVYEYVDNGNLEQWLHGDVGPHSPLTWEIRMNIILGTAKGYSLR